MNDYESLDQDIIKRYGADWLPNIPKGAAGGSRKFRRSLPIHGYVGENGGGKSLAAVHDTLPTLAGTRWKCSLPDHLHTKMGITEGFRPVLSTLRFIDPRTKKDHPLWIPYHDHRQLLSAEHCDIIMDEITGVASSRASASMPVQVSNNLVQLRRRDNKLRWTSPNWARSDTIIREVSQGVTYCKAKMKMPRPGKDWLTATWFVWSTYDAGNFEAFNVGTRERMVSETFQLYVRRAGGAQDFYDTLGEVLAVGASNDAGICIRCWGKRSIVPCKCDRTEETAEVLLEYAADWQATYVAPPAAVPGGTPVPSPVDYSEDVLSSDLEDTLHVCSDDAIELMKERMNDIDLSARQEMFLGNKNLPIG